MQISLHIGVLKLCMHAHEKVKKNQEKRNDSSFIPAVAELLYIYIFLYKWEKSNF